MLVVIIVLAIFGYLLVYLGIGFIVTILLEYKYFSKKNPMKQEEKIKMTFRWPLVMISYWLE